ncbi:MAG: hypothetical protein EOO12_05610 [Chitinophagaceae bacterium]|nr:MAG: hypothetical protein EOO12_05610 [Chitinophagaceae bacterium]
MKKFATRGRILILAFCTLSLSALAQSKSNCKDSKKVEVLFHNRMSQKDLDQIAENMARQHFKISYLQRKFDASGHLSYLKFSVDTPDGFSGNAGASLSGQKFGFVRNCRNKKAPFVVGNL